MTNLVCTCDESFTCSTHSALISNENELYKLKNQLELQARQIAWLREVSSQAASVLGIRVIDRFSESFPEE